MLEGQIRPTRLCQLCDMYVEEYVPHILFTCPMVVDKLNLVWTTVSQVAPQAPDNGNKGNASCGENNISIVMVPVSIHV